MATFPALNPNARTYIPGQAPATPIPTLDGDELSVRHTNTATGHILRLTYTGLTTAQHFELTSHYMLHGRYQTFDLPAIVLLGSNLSFPSGYLWLYVDSPQTTYEPGLITTTVELELLPPYSI